MTQTLNVLPAAQKQHHRARHRSSGLTGSTLLEDTSIEDAVDSEATRWDDKRQIFFIGENASHRIEVQHIGRSWVIVMTPSGSDDEVDRWCYSSFVAAYLAAERWDWTRDHEPEGWNRHPRSGRMRTYGAEDQAFVAW